MTDPMLPDVRWSMSQRLAQALLALPASLVTRWLGPAIERDGRILDRRVQMLLALGDRTGRTQRDLTVAAMRKDLLTLARLGMPRIPAVDTVDFHIDGPRGPVPARTYRPRRLRAPAAAIVYYHGGGWVCGDLESHDASCRLLATVADCVVVAVDYRLAPEHPYPAAVDDAVAAYGWVQQRTTEMAIAPGRIGVMGDSAGGNLAAVVCQAARGHRLPPPLAQGLVYPCVDMEFRADSHRTVGNGFGLEQRTMQWFRDQYIPEPSLWRSPQASPLFAADLTGLPPAMVVTAGFDPLRDEGDAYAAALDGAGVAVHHLRYDDMIHGFFGMGLLPGGLQRSAEICAAMGDLLHGRTPVPPR